MKRWVLSAMALVAACGQGNSEAPVDKMLAPAPGTGFQMRIDVKVKPHEEAWRCVIGKLPVEGTQTVRRVTHVQSKAMHHMDLMVLLNSGIDLPPGDYDCNELYTKYPKLMEEIILYASQNPEGEIVLPPGTAARIPGALTVMFEVHHVNVTDQEQELFSLMNAYTMPSDDVRETIWGGAIRDRHLTIPPRSDVVEWSRCVMNEDIDLLFLSTHTHRLGKDVRVFRYDGKTTGEEIFPNDVWDAPPLKAFDKAPLKVKKGEGFEFRCHYVNPGDSEVRWGFHAADEMCNLAIVHTPGNPAIKCQVTETSDGKIIE